MTFQGTNSCDTEGEKRIWLRHSLQDAADGLRRGLF